MAVELLATSKNGTPVYLNHEKTNVHLHIQENPNLLELAKEAIAQQTLVNEPQIVFEQDMKRVIGTTSLVKTSPDDEIIYAKRKGRDTYSRFVKGRELTETSCIAVVLRQVDDVCVLWTAWCGRLLPREAYEDNAHEPSGFWATHALVYDESLVQLDTVEV